MNKHEALARLDALENEAAALRRIIEAPEAKKPLVQPSAEYGYPVFWGNDEYEARTTNGAARNAFETSKQAQAYAEAFNCLLDLRRQPGSEAAEGGKGQWFINGEGYAVERVTLAPKLSSSCPPFDSQESAEAARDAVGLDRILKMYNTLHGRGHE